MHPPKVRHIKPYQYRVQSGDDVGSIAGFFGMPEHRWPELVGANPQKPLGFVPEGMRHRCFQALNVGEPLNVPANWREPIERRLGLGAVGEGILIPNLGAPNDLLQVFTTAVNSTVGTIPPNILNNPPAGIPAGDLLNQLSAVVYSWWPHMGNTMPVPPLPTTSVDLLKVIAQMTPDKWFLLLSQANEFLKATRVTKADSPSTQNIPWSDIPWQTFPWDKLQMTPEDWGKFTGMVARIGRANPGNMPMPAASVDHSPNFLTTNWSQQKYVSFVGGNSNWSDFLTTIMNDQKAQQCIKANPGLLTTAQGCPTCWDGPPSVLIDKLCAGKICDCPGSGSGGGTTPGGGGTATLQKDNTGWYVAAGIGAVAVLAFLASGKK